VRPGTLPLMLTLILALAIFSNDAYAIDKEYQIVTSINIWSNIINMLTSPHEIARPLLTGMETPHTFSLKPEHIQAVKHASMIIYTSDRIEPFMKEILSSVNLENKTVVKVVDLPNITIVNDNPHIWMNPLNVKIFIEYVSELISERFPHLSETIAKNRITLLEQIDNLMSYINSVSQDLEDIPVIVSIPCIEPLVLQLKLRIVKIVVEDPERSPSLKEILEINELIKEYNVTSIIDVIQLNSPVIEKIVSMNNLKRAYTSPLLISSKGLDNYFKLMRYNIAAIHYAIFSPMENTSEIECGYSLALIFSILAIAMTSFLMIVLYWRSR